MERKAFGGRKRYDLEGWKKSPKRRAVQRDKLKGQEGEGHHSPSNVRSRIRGSGGVEEDTTIDEINDAIRRGRESMPKEPPSAGEIRKGDIIWVFAEEMTIIATISRIGTGSRVTKRLKKVKLNKVPAGSKGAGRSVGNVNEAIRR